MKEYLHFFNYDLTNKVQSSNIAPDGYYTSVQIGDSGTPELHKYYHGTDPEGINTKTAIWSDSFAITENMIIFEY